MWYKLSYLGNPTARVCHTDAIHSRLGRRLMVVDTLTSLEHASECILDRVGSSVTDTFCTLASNYSKVVKQTQRGTSGDRRGPLSSGRGGLNGGSLERF